MGKKWIAIILLCLFLLTGCSMDGLDPQSLMRPPRPTGEREEIHKVLERQAGSNFKLRYPRRGDYRSAIIMQDLTGNGKEEAIALYEEDDGEITIMFIGKRNNVWEELGAYTNPAAEVDMVCFGDVNSDGVKEIVVGWGSGLNNASNICIYSYAESTGKMSEISMNQSYNQMVVMDFNGDGYEEIFTACISTAEQPAYARLSRINNGQIETMGTANLDIGVTRYISVASGKLNEKESGVLLDGIKSSGTTAAYVTELLYWDQENQTLQSPFYNPNTQSADYVKRYTSVISRDVDGDGCLEIPIVTVLPGYTIPAPDNTYYLTNWYHYNCQEETLTRVNSMIINSADGYWFVIPDMWRDHVTVKTDADTKTMTFHEWIPPQNETDPGAIGGALLRIKVFTQQEWESENQNGEYTQLGQRDNFIYAVAILQSDNALSLLMKDIESAFGLIE